MTIFFGFHIGYLVACDANGVWIGWGQRRQRKPGEPIFLHNHHWVFPWWWSARNIRQWLYVERCRRLQRRMDRRAGKI